MKYALDCTNLWISLLREEAPLSKSSSDRIKRSDVLPLKQLVLAHYEIDPFSKKKTKESNLQNFDFLDFAEQGDEHSIFSLFRSSVYAGKVKCIDAGSILEPTEREVYANWAPEKGFPLPECLTDNVFPWTPPSSIKDIHNINFNEMPDSILAALGCNIVAQGKKRALERSKEPVKIAKILRSEEMLSFVNLCAESEGKQPKEDTTIREYIQTQFQDSK